MSNLNEELSNVITSVKTSTKERIWLIGMVLFLYFFDKYYVTEGEPFAATLSLIIIVAHLMQKQDRTAKALELLQSTHDNKSV